MNDHKAQEREESWLSRVTGWINKHGLTVLLFSAFLNVGGWLGAEWWEAHREQVRFEIENEHAALNARFERLDHLGNEFNLTFYLFARNVIEDRAVDLELRNKLVQNIAKQQTELARLRTMLPPDEGNLVERYASRLADMRASVMRTNEFSDMNDAYSAVKALLLDREVLLRDLQGQLLGMS
ncbi:hypothetical protein [Lentisalinibacter salinarum]|uniref:hypothetical protein n=1 Tax=Lentisalinibacter salinarum TaxID=2992239 RepID=UPI00386FF163